MNKKTNKTSDEKKKNEINKPTKLLSVLDR